MIKQRLTYNQIEILRIIHSFKYLPLRGLFEITKRRGLFTYKQSLQSVISKLETKGLIKSFYYGNNWKVVYITPRSGEVIADSLGVSKRSIVAPNQGHQIKFATLEHTLSIVEIYNKLVSNFEIRNWLGDQQVYCQYEFRSNRDGSKVIRNLLPDGYFEIIDRDKSYKFFLEYDTGTMDRDQLAIKFRRYFEYYVYGNWRVKYNEFPSVLFITERKESEMWRLVQMSDVESMLKSRDLFQKSKNVVYKGIGLSDNIKTINSRVIRDYLKIKYIFTYMNNDLWINALKAFISEQNLKHENLGLFDETSVSVA